ncbi:MAG: protein-L-isoaspartate(D-aspartate) O-methyltransferase [Bacteroidia bacterium]|nr:protein-L-isoaspartate(D-aspartate) O-methyltransferase [Bacteroidia bacterium]
MDDSFRDKGLRKKLVDEIRRKGIHDEAVLEAMNRVPRHLFMDSSFIGFAYQDRAFPIAAGQTISQPYTVAYQTRLLQVKKGEKVLEIGTGSGYQAAILAEMGVKVYSIERQRELYLSAKTLLHKLGYKVQMFYGDGYEGLPTYGPFDKILITAAAPSVPEKLTSQLVNNGRLVVPVGETGSQIMTVIDRISDNEFVTKKYDYFTFVPLLKGTAR